MAGSLGSHRALVSAITRAFGGVTLAIDYRRAPEHPFPAGLDDCVAAHDWVRANGPGGAEPADSVAIAGDSAGGNLALAACLVLRDGPGTGPDAVVAMLGSLLSTAISPACLRCSSRSATARSCCPTRPGSRPGSNGRAGR